MDKNIEALEQGYKDLIELEDHPTFRKWRDATEAVFMKEIDLAKENCLNLDEANLKALILYEAKIKRLFGAFRDAKELQKVEKET
jgi:hypothetical protein